MKKAPLEPAQAKSLAKMLQAEGVEAWALEGNMSQARSGRGQRVLGKLAGTGILNMREEVKLYSLTSASPGC